MNGTLLALACTFIATALPSAALAGPDEGDAMAPMDGKIASKRATIAADGLAVAPASAPRQVAQIIAAGNAIARAPYKYGGGHGIWRDSGYDCSGSVSYALHGAGLLDVALDSSGLAAFGKPGRGRWVTIMGNPGHAYMVVAGLRFDTNSSNQTGSRWSEQARSPAGYAVRHPAGL
jgi:hypothetical protein